MKKKLIRLIAVFFAAFVACSLTACSKKNDQQYSYLVDLSGDYDKKLEGSGNLSSRTVELSDRTYELTISGIKYSGGSFKVVITPSGNSAVIEADDNAVNDFKLSVDDNAGTIILSANNDTMYSNVNCTVILNAAVSGISAEGAYVIEYTTPENAESIDISVSGAVKVTASGAADRAVYKIEGGSSLYAEGLKAGSVTVDVSGASKAEIYAESSLDVTASGTSTVKYSGDPGTVNDDVSGLASVTKK